MLSIRVWASLNISFSYSNSTSGDEVFPLFIRAESVLPYIAIIKELVKNDLILGYIPVLTLISMQAMLTCTND